MTSLNIDLKANFFFRTVIERSSVKIDTILTYCHYCMNDSSLEDYLSYFKVSYWIFICHFVKFNGFSEHNVNYDC